MREALAELDAKNAKSFGSRECSLEAQQFFRCHDIAHVIFDCNTSMSGEGKVKIWSMFGRTLGFWEHIRGYSEANAFSLFRQYSLPHVLRSIVSLAIAMPRAFYRAKRMSKPWPWLAHDSYLDTSIKTIREEFKIRPL